MVVVGINTITLHAYGWVPVFVATWLFRTFRVPLMRGNGREWAAVLKANRDPFQNRSECFLIGGFWSYWSVCLSVYGRVRFSILSYSVTSVPVSAEFSPASYDKTESAIRDGCGPYRMSHLIIIVVAKALDEKHWNIITNLRFLFGLTINFLLYKTGRGGKWIWEDEMKSIWLNWFAPRVLWLDNMNRWED